MQWSSVDAPSHCLLLLFLCRQIKNKETEMKKIIALALFSSMFAAPAFAEGTGFYGALDVNAWTLSNKAANTGNPSAGVQIAGGYHFTPNWGAELAYTESGNATTPGGDYKVTSVQLVATGTYPVNEQFDLFAKVGWAANKASGAATAGCSNCTKDDGMFGVGAQYNFNKQFGVRAQYVDIGKITDQGNDPKGSYFGLGVVYNF
jgi:OOP family OmpA-OmpF porin